MTKRIVAIINQKGGVGKTTTAINLAAALAACGRRVTLIDMDPQGNATTGLGVKKNNGLNSSYGLLIGARSFKETQQGTCVPNLSVVPSTIDLSAAEIELVTQKNRESSLKRSLKDADADYIFIDCPPGFGLITLNALNTADKIVIPLQCEFFALEGLAQLIQTIKSVRGSINKNLKISGIVLTMFDTRNKLSYRVAQDVQQHFADLVFKTVIPKNIKISEAPSFGLPVLMFDHKCAGTIAYVELAKEFLSRERATQG